MSCLKSSNVRSLGDRYVVHVRGVVGHAPPLGPRPARPSIALIVIFVEGEGGQEAEPVDGPAGQSFRFAWLCRHWPHVPHDALLHQFFYEQHALLAC